MLRIEPGLRLVTLFTHTFLETMKLRIEPGLRLVTLRTLG